MRLLLLAGLAVCSTQAATITNAGFETGDYTGWSDLAFTNAAGPASGAPNYATFVLSQAGSLPQTSGNTVVTQQNSNYDGTAGGGAGVNPTEGSYLAALSNENASGETCSGGSCVTGSSVSQNFLLPINPTTLTFNAQFLTNDGVVGGVGSNDFGGVALLSGGSVLAQFNLDGDATSSADVHATIGNAAGDFLSSTGWVTGSFNIGAYGGQNVTLIGYVNQGVELGSAISLAESRLLIDNFQVNSSGAGATPEPSSFAMLALGAAGIAWRIRSRRSLRIESAD